MEEKIVLAHLLRKFEIKSLKTTEELRPTPELILKPAEDLPVLLTPRF
jgi:hypothetical protein